MLATGKVLFWHLRFCNRMETLAQFFFNGTNLFFAQFWEERQERHRKTSSVYSCMDVCETQTKMQSAKCHVSQFCQSSMEQRAQAEKKSGTAAEIKQEKRAKILKIFHSRTMHSHSDHWRAWIALPNSQNHLWRPNKVPAINLVFCFFAHADSLKLKFCLTTLGTLQGYRIKQTDSVIHCNGWIPR